MSVVLAGVSHKTCPVDVRERLSALNAGDVLKRLRGQRFEEAVVLTTCNRFEVCAAVGNAEPQSFLSRLTRLMDDWSGGLASKYAYQLSRAETVRHISPLPAGLIPWSWARRRSWAKSKALTRRPSPPA